MPTLPSAEEDVMTREKESLRDQVVSAGNWLHPKLMSLGVDIYVSLKECFDLGRECVGSDKTPMQLARARYQKLKDEHGKRD